MEDGFGKDWEGIGHGRCLGTISAFAWSDFGKPWESEIRMAAPGIEPGSPRVRVQKVHPKRALKSAQTLLNLLQLGLADVDTLLCQRRAGTMEVIDDGVATSYLLHVYQGPTCHFVVQRGHTVARAAEVRETCAGSASVLLGVLELDRDTDNTRVKTVHDKPIRARRDGFRATPECKGGETGEILEKTRRIAATSCTIPTYENPGMALAGIHPVCLEEYRGLGSRSQQFENSSVGAGKLKFCKRDFDVKKVKEFGKFLRKGCGLKRTWKRNKQWFRTGKSNIYTSGALVGQYPQAQACMCGYWDSALIVCGIVMLQEKIDECVLSSAEMKGGLTSGIVQHDSHMRKSEDLRIFVRIVEDWRRLQSRIVRIGEDCSRGLQKIGYDCVGLLRIGED
ncbi:hypothetical protein PR048_014492 [Dryococelus australis]|uniref:Uncharacterized protein n=1 Tax=Dryococelus australis TaxID=614101 RepID=A0ABQ9HEJ3_9NEOP|nr:hypothetical protein PR048_014492 [Dryococelus australis]